MPPEKEKAYIKKEIETIAKICGEPPKGVSIPFLCLESFRFLDFAVLGFPSRVSSSSVPNLVQKHILICCSGTMADFPADLKP
jgi:hypothetical protein